MQVRFGCASPCRFWGLTISHTPSRPSLFWCTGVNILESFQSLELTRNRGVESNLIVIAACVPAIGQIIRLFRGEPRPFRAVDSPAHPLRSNRQRPVVLSDGSNGRYSGAHPASYMRGQAHCFQHRALAWPVTIESVRGHNSTGKFESAQPGLHLQQGFPLKRNRRHVRFPPSITMDNY